MFVSLFFLIEVSGQSFGGNNSLWVYDVITGGFGSEVLHGIIKVEPGKDTVVANIPSRKFNRELSLLQGDTVFTRALSSFYIHSNEGLVLYSTDEIHFDTLYNFDLDIGESWSIHERNGQGDTTRTLTYVVKDTFTVQLNGVNVFCKSTEWFPGFVDTLYEDIGSRLTFILPFKHENQEGSEGRQLRCFYNDIIGAYDFRAEAIAVLESAESGNGYSDFEFECGSFVSTQPIEQAISEFQVFPNPASTTLHIQSKSERIRSLSLYNLQGIPVHERQGNENTLDLDISHLPSGMYFVLINESYFEKVAISR